MSFCNSLTFFRIWTMAEKQQQKTKKKKKKKKKQTNKQTQAISNVIWQSHGVHLVNMNVYAKFHHNIPLSSRDRAIITFSEFGARQSLDQWNMSFCNFFGLDLVRINVYATVYQNIPLSLRDRAIFTFSEFGARQSFDRWKMSFCNSLS